MKDNLSALLLGFLWCFCFGCNQSKARLKEADSFYLKTGLMDRLSIPLIKPYKLIKISDTEWRLELQTTKLLALSIHNVQGVDIVKNKILIYSKGGTEVNNIQYDELWFIIDPASLSEQAFPSFKAFKKALSGANISSVNLRDPDTFYKELYNKSADDKKQ